MEGFLIVGALGVVVLALFFWVRGRSRRTGGLPVPPEGRARLPDEPKVPTKPLYQVREGGDGGGSG